MVYATPCPVVLVGAAAPCRNLAALTNGKALRAPLASRLRALHPRGRLIPCRALSVAHNRSPGRTGGRVGGERGATAKGWGYAPRREQARTATS